MKSILLSGLAIGIVFCGSAVQRTFADDGTQQQLVNKINSMQTEIDELKAQVRQQQSAVDPAEDAKVMAQIQADAIQHSQLLDTMGVTAGYANRRFYIQSDDGNFVLRPWIHIQIRDSTAWRQDFNADGSDDTQNGFEIRRARFGFDGNLFTPDFTYFINWATNRANSTLTVTNSAGQTVGTTTSPVGGVPVLEEAWAKYHFDDSPWYVHVGQMHDPLDHENMVGSKMREPEASLQGDIFGNTDTFTKAATLIYFDRNGPLRIEGGVNDGIRAANTNFEDYPNNGNAYDGGVAGRLEWKLTGDWGDYDQLTALGDKKNLVVLGTGYDYSYAGGAYNTLSHTADIQFGGPSGLFAYLCYFGRYTEHNRGIPLTSNPGASFSTPTPDLGKDTYEPSVDAEFAWLLGGHFEPFLRYEYMYLRGTPAGSQNNVTEVGVGANYYFSWHNLVLTQLISYLPTGIPISDTSSDVLTSNRRAELIFITQIQLLL